MNEKKNNFLFILIILTITHQALAKNIPFGFFKAQGNTCSLGSPSAFTWMGGGGNTDWNNNANWNGSAAPGAGDTAIFDGNCVSNCSPTINTSISVAGIDMKCSYAGNITQGAGNTITVGSSNWTVAGGTFTGNNASITINGRYIQSGGVFSAGSGNMLVTLTDNIVTMFTQTGGNFTSTSGTLTVLNGQYTVNGDMVLFKLGASATFLHNNGTVSFEGKNSWNWHTQFTLDINPGNLDLYNVIVNGHNSSGAGGHRINTGQTITVLNDFTLQKAALTGGSNASPAAWGEWILKGNNNTFNSGFDKGNGGTYGTVRFAGTGNQTYSCSQTSLEIGPKFVVDKLMGTLTTASANCNFAGFDLQQGSFSAPTGILTLGFNFGNFHAILPNTPWNVFNINTGTTFTHNNGTVTFDGKDLWTGNGFYTLTTPSNFSLYNVNIDGSVNYPGGHNISLGSLIVTNSFSWTSGSLYGSWALQGNVSLTSSAMLYRTHNGAASFTFSGSNNQNLSGTAPPPTGLVTVNKSGGSLILQNNISFAAIGQNLTITSNTLDMWGSDLNVAGALTIEAGGSLICNGGALSHGSFSNSGSYNCANPTHTFTSVGSIATAQNKTSSNSFAFSPSTTISSGNLAILVVAADNLSASNGNNNEHTTVTDSVGNTWKKRSEYTNSRSSAAAGTTVSIWSGRITTSVTTSDSITVNFSSNITAKAATGWQFSFTGAPGFSIAGSTTVGDVGTDPTNLTIGSLTSNQYLWVRAVAAEDNATTFTASTNYTTFTHTSSTTSGSSGTSNIGARGEFRIFTGTTDSSNPTGTAVDNASAYIAIQ